MLNDVGFAVFIPAYLPFCDPLAGRACQLQGAVTFGVVDFHSPWICGEMPLTCELPGPVRLCPLITGVSFKYKSLILISG